MAYRIGLHNSRCEMMEPAKARCFVVLSYVISAGVGVSSPVRSSSFWNGLRKGTVTCTSTPGTRYRHIRPAASGAEMESLVALSVLFCLCALSAAAPSAGNDPGQITNLPGADFNISFDQYAGFITVNESHGRKLFYWFVTSQRDPANDPVVLWLNGGPGCSSLTGFFSELGPFYPLEGGKTLAQNPYSWNKVANVIFLESPSGVGFSYSETTSDYKTGDYQTTQDSLQFLIEFFLLYPEFAANEFWVTGESYGGHYVPWLSNAILEYNNLGSGSINIKGFMAGNPWTDPYSDNLGAATFWVNAGIISHQTYNSMVNSCNFSVIGPLVLTIQNPPSVQDDCDRLVDEADKEMGNINLYAIYANVCTHEADKKLYSSKLSLLSPYATGVKDQDPCINAYVSAYLNREDVKDAIHASDSPNRWSECSGVVDYSRKDLLTPVLSLYRKFISENKLRILVYSGDIDGVVPHTGTEKWLSTLNLTVESSGFESWTASNKQVGGWVVHYKELTFTTVRGAGHMVPGTQPLYALDMFSRFLSGDF